MIEKTLPVAKVRTDEVEVAVLDRQILRHRRCHGDEQGGTDGVEDVPGQALLLRSFRVPVGRLEGRLEDDEGQDVHPEEGV